MAPIISDAKAVYALQWRSTPRLKWGISAFRRENTPAGPVRVIDLAELGRGDCSVVSSERLESKYLAGETPIKRYLRRTLSQG